MQTMRGLSRASWVRAVLAVVTVTAAGSATTAAGRPAQPAAASVVGTATPEAVSVPGGDGVRILRDEYGVPHVYARSGWALFFGEGYAVGQDRLWQAELLRRTGSGTLAEVTPGATADLVSSDLTYRAYTGGAARLRALADRLPAATRLAVRAFSAGMNAWIQAATAAGTLPAEYASEGFTPRPWTVQDVLATWMVIESRFGSFGADELSDADQLATWTATLGAGGAAEVFSDTHWLDDPSAPTTIPGRSAGPARPPGTAAGVGRARGPGRAGVSTALLARALAGQQATSRVLARVGQLPRWHSNAAVLSGRYTTDGAPLLLGGPQAEYSAPQTFMEIGLHGAGYDATGVTIPGTVSVEIGVGAHAAWSVTSGGSDNSDWYADTVDPTGHPGRYLFDGRWLPYACRTEIIAVRGQQAQRYQVCQGRHGPVLAADGGTALALRDAGAEGLDGTIAGFLALDAAPTRARFAAPLRDMAGNFNILYADQAGHIAYWHVGRIPIRAAGDAAFLPHPGDGSDEWQGFVPFSRMPHALDPAQGWLANWNNKPRADWSNSGYGFIDWGPVQRVQTLDRELATVRPHTADAGTLAGINRIVGQTAESPAGDESNITVHQLLPMLLSGVAAAADPRLPGVQRLLAEWDGQRVDADNDGRYDDPAAAIYQQWYPTFIDHAFAGTIGSVTSRDAVDDTVLTDMAVRLLQGRTAAAPLRHDYLHGEPVSHAVTTSLLQTLDSLAITYRSADPRRWLLPDVATRWEPLGLGAVADTPWMNRGTYNQIVHLGAGTGLTAIDVVAPGQNGEAGNPHFADQLALYATWQYKPMRLTTHDLRGHLTGDILLTATP